MGKRVNCFTRKSELMWRILMIKGLRLVLNLIVRITRGSDLWNGGLRGWNERC